MKIGYICAGNKEFSDFWLAVFEEEEKEIQTQKRKEKQSDREKTTLDDDAGKNDLTRRDDTSCQ